MSTAIILARGGSKGLPGKNLRKINGFTLLANAIRTAYMAGYVGQVIVSTDDEAIAVEARQCEARVIDRPPHLATDEASSWDAIRHAIRTQGLTGSIALIQCTAPLMTHQDIQGTVNALQCVENAENTPPIGGPFPAFQADMAVCVTPDHGVLLASDGRPINWDIRNTRRQQRQQQFRIAGSVWAFDCKYCLECEQYTGKLALHVAQNPIQIDIDTEADLQHAAAVLSMGG